MFRLAAPEGAQQVREGVGVDLGVDDDPAGSIWRLLVNDRIDHRNGIEAAPEGVEIEEIGTGAERTESLARYRVTARPVEFGDADHECLGAESAGGQRRGNDLTIADGEVGVECSLLAAFRLGSGDGVLVDDGGPLLEVDAHAQPEPLV